MKKFFAISLAIVMILSLSITAFADLTATQTSEAITVTYTSADNTDTPVYGANVAWTDLAVTYSYGKNWDPAALDYTTVVEPEWVNADVKVTITNNSNAEIYSKVSYNTENGLSGAVSGDGEIAAATVGNAVNQVVTITISGTPTNLEVENGGTITVQLATEAFAE